MLSKAKTKFIKSLQLKKYRILEQCFIVEGEKGVIELLNSDFEIVTLVGAEDFIRIHASSISSVREVVEASEKELSGLGSFQTNDAVLAVARMKENRRPELKAGEWGIVLDNIKDPGNLGTIIRTADWYGVSAIVASTESTDCYNPKVIAASMGSFTRVNIFYTPLVDFLTTCGLPVYGTFLQGEDIHQARFERGGLIVIGNESNGISTDVEKKVKHRITIPSYGKAESLNAGIAVAVVLDNLRRLKK